MSVAPSTKKREAGASKPARRRFGRRLSATHVLIAVVVILAFVLNLLVLQDRSATTMVAVADRPLTTGSAVASHVVRLIPIETSFGALDGLVTEEDLDHFDGWVVGRALDEGDLIDRASLVQPGGGSGLREMSVPVAKEHAAGGVLAPGDRVDVISTQDDVAFYVAAGLEVTGVAESDGGAIGTTGQYHVVVAVTSDEALAIAEAIAAGSVEIVRSTGAEEIEGSESDGS